jgi:hypothetical protein
MRKLAAIAIATATALVFTSTASAKSLYFVGDADDDSATTIQFTAKGHYTKGKKKKKFVADEVSSIRVYDQSFVCYSANGAPGYSGRTTYSEYAFIDPIEVEKHGRFGGFDQVVYNSPYGGPPLTLSYVRFRGQIKNKKATGSYQTQVSEGGIEFGYCGDKNPADWTAKGQKDAPEPPPTPED